MAQDLDKARNLTQMVYFLYALSIITLVTALVAVIINYLKREDVAGTWLESHFRWQIRTFWFTLMWAAIGGITAIVGVGFVIWGLSGIWAIYRIVKGMLDFYDGKPMYA